MGNLVLLLLIFSLLLDFVTATSPPMDYSLPVGSGDAIYPDPEGFLSSFCQICALPFLCCNHHIAPLMETPRVSRFITAEDFYSHPEWPRDPEQDQIQQLAAPRAEPNRRQPLQRANVQTLDGGPTTIQPATLQVWAEGAYNPGDRTASPPPRRTPPKKSGFPCSHSGCRKVYDRQCDLKRHAKVHLNKSKRPYKCNNSDCYEAFVYPKDLERHQRTHRGSQKMSCPVEGCSNTDGFSRKDNYLRHMRNQHASVMAFYPM